MQPGSAAPEPAPFTPPKPAPTVPSRNLATMLAAVALALAVVAVGLSVALPGPTGPAGGSSTNGVPGVTLWAVVGSDGAISRSAGAASSYETSTGQYQVNFTQYLYACSYEAALGTTAYGQQPAGSASVASVPGQLHSLKVSTFDSSGTAASESFHLVVFCPGGMNAVIASNGTFVSGDGVAASERSAIGVYQVIFTVDVTSCAYIGALGEGGTPPPGSITTATYGGNTDGVWVNTYNSTGAATNESFQLSVYC
jgi:hypothetical protein